MDAKNLGYFIAFFVLNMGGFCDGIRRIPNEASYGSGFHWRTSDLDEIKGDEVSVFYRKQLREVIKYYNHNMNSDQELLRRQLITSQPTTSKQSLVHFLNSKTSFSHKPIKSTSLKIFGRPNDRILKPKSGRWRKRRRKQRRRRRRPRQPPAAAPTPLWSPPEEPASPYNNPHPKPEQQEKTKIPLDSPPEDSSSKGRKLLIIAVCSSIVAILAILSLCLVCFFGLKKKRTSGESNDGQRKGKIFASRCSLLSSKKAGSIKNIMPKISTKAASTPRDQSSGEESPPRTPPPSPPPPPPPTPPSPESPPPPPPAASPTQPEAAPQPPPLTGPPVNVPEPPKPKPPPPSGLGLHRRGRSGKDENKTKLKPFFWDKVNTSPNGSMVWDNIKGGSFQFNEEMMEDLFGYGSSGQNKNENVKGPSNLQSQPKLIQIIDPKKAQNLAILLKALNVTTQEVSDALLEGNELPVEFISTLMKMAPSPDEEEKLRGYNGDFALLGTAERFLKVLVDIPFAFKRLEALLFMSSLHEESSSVKDSFSTLEVACTALRNNRLFLKLLEAVLKTGNRMNVGTYRGGAQAFKVDTLLKLSDVKGTDSNTTLLSFVVHEMIRSEGNKAARRAKADRISSQDSQNYRKHGLDVVSKLSEELEDVKKAALVDGDTLTSTVLRLGNMLRKTKDFVNNEMKNIGEDDGILFRKFLVEFIDRAEGEIVWLSEEENRVMALVRSAGDYFHGESRKDEGLHLFVVVRDFLLLLDNVCNDIRRTYEIREKKNSSGSSWQNEKLFQSGNSSSDEVSEESDSP